MSFLKRIEEDYIKAFKSHDEVATLTLRGLKSDMKYYQIEKSLDKLSDDEIMGVISRAAKRRRDSIEQFAAGGRDDLVEKESKELQILEVYLPAQMGEDEIERLAVEAISEAGAELPSDIGKVMKVLMPKLKGLADGKIVKGVVSRLLSPK